MASHGSREAISPLDRPMLEDTSMRNFIGKTRKDYGRRVKTFGGFLSWPPDRAERRDLCRFQLHQGEIGVHPPSMNASVRPLRCFFRVTLDRPDTACHLTGVRQPHKLPLVLSPKEVARLLDCAAGPVFKHQAALSVA